ncbi:MAG TPA: DNA adenine methylase, partial [Planctomycetaceae bacterium]|nr:DNA adenine methylase [Planctomycetaceae bacterium]
MQESATQTRPQAPPTQGVKYAGSKRALLGWILRTIEPLAVSSVFDGFAGTTRVSQALAAAGYRVVSNDSAVWSRVFGQCFLLNHRAPEFYQPWIDHLNALPGRDGWFTAHYGGEPNGGLSVQADGYKRPWQIHNTRKLDAIRGEIDRLTDDPIERAVLLTSLMLALDQVDSSLGHHVSYLKQWAPRSYRTLRLRVPRCSPSNRAHAVHCDDVRQLAPQVETDLAYFDPPYGSANDKMPPSRVRYASYYHLWTTICLNDQPEVSGAARRRVDASDVRAASDFEDFRRGANGRFRVIEELEQLLKSTRARYILLSYSNQGRATRAELAELLDGLG